MTLGHYSFSEHIAIFCRVGNFPLSLPFLSSPLLFFSLFLRLEEMGVLKKGLKAKTPQKYWRTEGIFCNEGH